MDLFLKWACIIITSFFSSNSEILPSFHFGQVGWPTIHLFSASLYPSGDGSVQSLSHLLLFYSLSLWGIYKEDIYLSHFKDLPWYILVLSDQDPDISFLVANLWYHLLYPSYLWSKFSTKFGDCHYYLYCSYYNNVFHIILLC